MFTHRTRVPLLVAACAALALVLPCAGAAQLVPHPRAKIGVFLPNGDSSTASIGDVWLKVGVDLALPLGLPLLGGTTRVEADYEFSGRSSVLPVTLSEVWQPSALIAKSPVYFGVGVGVWFTHIRGVDNTTRLGARLLAGVGLSGNTFLEAHYDFVERRYGTSVDGLSLMIGTRF